jgi:hypothetical protein
MEQAAAEWRYAELHKDLPFHDGTFTSWAKERSLSHPYHLSDGVSVWVAESDLTPHDHFLGGAKDCAECSAPDAGGLDSQSLAGEHLKLLG